MRPEFKRSVRQTSPGHAPLPPDVGFLRAYGISLSTLRVAQGLGAQWGVPAATALLASGAVSATLYYRALAHHIGVQFIGGFAPVATGEGATAAVWQGRVRLKRDRASDPDWLFAPDHQHVTALLRVSDRRSWGAPAVAVTTPAHLAVLARRKDATRIAHDAGFGLQDLDRDLSAKTVLDAARSWKGLLVFVAAALLVGMESRIASAATGLLFFAAIVCRLLACVQAGPQPSDPPALEDADLPVYSVIVPLHDEAAMVPELLANLTRLDYPPAKLEIKFLLEADDRATRLGLEGHALPPGYEIIVAPDSPLRTKPRALNVALPIVRGTLVTVYDAEDAPEPDQLRKAAARFRQAPAGLACLQARIAVNNAGAGWLPRLYAIEYAALFDLYNVGVAALGWPMALGGTSNHVKTEVLRAVGGWDAWNVAEDADLGFRLARFGYRIDMLNSTTFEQAPTTLGGWFKQRRRWTKGWLQTILVLAWRPTRTLRDFGMVRTGIVVLMAAALIIGPVISPAIVFMMAIEIGWHGWPSPRDVLGIVNASLWVSVFTIGVSAPLWCGYEGIRARGLKGCLTSLPLIVPYQLLISIAALAGLYDLVTKPYHWHKTNHLPMKDD